MRAIDGALRTQTPVENNNEKQQITAFGGDRVRRGWTFRAHQAAPSRQKSPQRSPTRASCAALVNALFWKILVTRVKHFVACPGRSAARVQRVVRCRHRSRVYPRSALKCAPVGQARLAWTVTHRFLAEMLQREHLLGVARRRWPA